MEESTKTKPVYDLEERTFQFEKHVRLSLKYLDKTFIKPEDRKQLVRAFGSVAANCIEANESLGKKDFQMRINSCRKEAKESAFWIRLIPKTNDRSHDDLLSGLCKEANELKKICSAILQKSTN